MDGVEVDVAPVPGRSSSAIEMYRKRRPRARQRRGEERAREHAVARADAAGLARSEGVLGHPVKVAVPDVDAVDGLGARARDGKAWPARARRARRRGFSSCDMPKSPGSDDRT